MEAETSHEPTIAPCPIETMKRVVAQMNLRAPSSRHCVRLKATLKHVPTKAGTGARS